MNQQADPLISLLVDSAEIDREALRKAIDGIVSIDKSSGGLHFHSRFGTLDARGKIIGVLLGRKAAYLLGKIPEEPLAVKEIVAVTALPRGTVAPVLMQLRERYLVQQDDGKRYFIPPAKLHAAIEAIAVKEAAHASE